jgi:hypothetical protein
MKQTKNKLEQLGFKKVRGTEPGFHMYELNPAELESRQRIHDNLKAEEKEYNRTKNVKNK